MEEVFCVADYYEKNSLREYWGKIKRKINQNTSEGGIVVQEHSLVYDREANGGGRLCRPQKLYLPGLMQGGDSGFSFYVNTLKSVLVVGLEATGLEPNFFIALGGARVLAWKLQASGAASHALSSCGVMEMSRVVDRDKVTGFEYNQSHLLPGVDYGDIVAVVVEDFINTGRSTEMAIQRIRSFGGKVVAVVSFGNALGDEWPFDVPINITFLNFDYSKYPAGTCPTCLAAKSAH